MDVSELEQICESIGFHPDVLWEYNLDVQKVRVVRGMLKVRTASASWMLKKVYATEEHLDYVHLFSEYIANRGLSNVPRFVRNVYGDAYVAHQTGLYYMTRWFAGREADFRKEVEMNHVMRLLGEWHNAAAGFTHPDGWLPDAESFEDRFRRLANQAAAFLQRCHQKEQHTPFERLFLACSDELQTRTESALEEFAAAGVPDLHTKACSGSMVAHGRVLRQNVLFDGETYCLLDYDKVHQAHPLTDVAVLLQRYMPAYEWSPEVLRAFVASYQVTAKLQPTELERLPAMLAAPVRPLQAVVWYMEKGPNWDEEDYVDYLESSMELEEARERARASMFRQSLYRGTDIVNVSAPAAERGLLPSPNHQNAPVSLESESRDVPVSWSGAPGKEADVAIDDDGSLIVRVPEPPKSTANSPRAHGRRRKRRRDVNRENRGDGPHSTEPGLRVWRKDGGQPGK